jgi:hypothetical protein
MGLAGKEIVESGGMLMAAVHGCNARTAPQKQVNALQLWAACHQHDAAAIQAAFIADFSISNS